MFNMESIGRRIAELRKKANMTQMELADNMGITFQSISNWERGNTMPDISKLSERNRSSSRTSSKTKKTDTPRTRKSA